MRYKTYILYSKTLDSYYVGYTGDEMHLRLAKHNTHHRGFTGRASDWTVVHLETFETKKEAMDREKAIKRWKSRKLIEHLVWSTPT